MFDEKDLYHFLVNGFFEFRDSSLYNSLKPDELVFFEITNDKKDNIVDGVVFDVPEWLEAVGTTIEAKLTRIFPSVRLFSIGYWDGVDPGSQRWHDDLAEGHDLSVLLYLDDTDETSGGDICIKKRDNMHCIYPKRGDIICIDHTQGVLHKASPSKNTRRLIAFEFSR